MNVQLLPMKKKQDPRSLYLNNVSSKTKQDPRSLYPNNVSPKKRQDPRPIYSTNEVVEQEQKNRTTYYLPCYVRFQVREILEVDIQKMQASVSGTLYFSFYYGKIDKDILKQLIGKGKCLIHLQITAKDPITLKQQDTITITHEKDKCMMHYRIRKQFTFILKSEVDYSPFDIMNLHLKVVVPKVTIDPDQDLNSDDRAVKKKRIDIKFNCMNSNDVNMVISGQDVFFKDFNIAKYYMQAKYHNTDSYLFQKIQFFRNTRPVNYPSDTFSKVNQFRYVNFRIPLYKHPGASLIQIFVPLWILGFITLLIFFQQLSLSGRISIIATLTLAFIAFIPVINTRIPQTPNIKLVQTITTVLCLIDSLILYSTTQDANAYIFVWNQDPLFMASMAINILNIFSVLALFALHRFYWETKYLAPQKKSSKVDKINRQEWANKECDDHFRRFINDKKVRVI